PQPSSPDTKRLSECLRRIGDELDSNMELQRMIEQVGCHAPKELFFRVAAEMFADGTFNWGRVVALFYFACKLVLRGPRCPVLPGAVGDDPDMWLMAPPSPPPPQEGLLSYFGTPTWQTITIFAAGVL
ncbi:Apoptosis regulator BAX, partial [Aptenodytes forsteri]